MDRVKCPHCGEDHDLSEIEPSFDRPDAYFEIPKDERADRSWNADSACMLRETETTPRQHFLRVVLPIPVRGEKRVYCWGTWVEVTPENFDLAMDLWEDPAPDGRSFEGTLANSFPDMVETLGLRGIVHLRGIGKAPEYHLDSSSTHPLAMEQRDGVFPERVIEWAARSIHAR